MSLLEVVNLVSGYGPLPVLHQVSLRVEEGELVSLIGPNGAGKSTLLHTVAGVLPCMAGEIRFNGRPLTGLDPSEVAAVGIGYVPQRQNVFADMTVRENLEVAAQRFADGGRRIEAEFERFPRLHTRRRQRAGTLSGGERQMLALAAALIQRPRLLMLDEPTTGLAPQIIAGLIEQIDQIRHAGTTVLWVVEENPRQVLSRAERVYLMESGVIRAENKGQELLAQPDFDRMFLGT